MDIIKIAVVGILAALALLLMISYITNIIVAGVNSCILYRYQCKLDYFKETQKLQNKNEKED
ncbi:hypothetical protein [Apilactobacillus xinyiensis]|uniref:hypothetical protein n=1 Tax=Apilactobacillus xinyiensis TaxID=2841032 RepID=UPI001C7DD707|nr:hypothetical protein [Apilactobacillus xinyiensis]